MTAVLNIGGFFCLNALLSLRCDEEPVQTLPIASALLIFSLYVLAFFGC